MNARTGALVGSLALVVVLGGLTVDVILESGFDVLVLLSLAIVGMVGVGVVGALFNPPEE